MISLTLTDIYDLIDTC